MKRGRRADASDEEDEDYEEATPSQRQRVDGDDDENVEYNPEPESQFVKGAITRVVLRNFMTYGGPVEIKPGPRLNLVLGPNGTGKSSFVCAICIGLGFGTKLLARAKDLHDYIKSGEKYAEINIWLSQGAGERPLQVTRRFGKGGDSEFKLNGKKATAKDVAKKMREMTVQMDNLCQFLPQDRVVAFAQLSPKELLEETEKAVDEEGLYKEHMYLKETKNGIRGAEQALETDKKELDRLEQAQEAAQRDVEKVQERNRLEDELALMEKLLPHCEALEAQTKWSARRDAAAESAKEVATREKEAQQANAPVKAVEAELAKFQQAAEKGKAGASKLEGEQQKFGEVVEAADEEIKKLRVDILREEKREKQRLNAIQKQETELAETEKKLSELRPPAETYDPAEIDAINKKVKELSMSQRNYLNQERELQQVIHDAKRRLADSTRQLAAISSLREQRFATLLGALRQRRMHKQADELQITSDFVAANADKFKLPVFGPIACEVQAQDQQVAAYLEQAVDKRFWRQYVVQCQADYDVLHRNTPASVSVYAGNPDAPMNGQIPQGLLDDLAEFGVTGTLDRAFEAPPVIKRVLCDNSGLQRHVVKEIVDKADACNVQLGSVWTPQSCFSSSRSRYDQSLSTSVNPIKQSEILGRTTDDSARKEAAEKQKAEAEGIITDSEAELRMFAKQRKEDESVLADLNRRRDQFDQEKMNHQRETKALQSRILQLRRGIDGDKKAGNFQEKKAKVEALINKKASQLVAATIQGTLAHTEWVRVTVEDYCPAQLAVKEGKARREALLKECQKSLESVNEAKKELKKLQDIASAAKALFQDLKGKAEKVGKLTASEEALRSGNPDKYPEDPDELRAAIEEKRAEIAAIFCADPTVLQQYQERAKRVDELRKKVKESESALAKVHSDIALRLAAWLPKLRALITDIAEKFNDAFKIIGSVGTVSLFEPEDGDFGKYEARILVRFRDGEQMCQLTANRQSGGERSVSTMFFLICLQDLTKCPFRMVDEINQGMDKKNERLVFQEMVRTSSKANTPQCFLITPKLLPQLDYGKFTTVHSIFNGQHVADVARNWTPEQLFGSMPQTPLQTNEAA